MLENSLCHKDRKKIVPISPKYAFWNSSLRKTTIKTNSTNKLRNHFVQLQNLAFICRKTFFRQFNPGSKLESAHSGDCSGYESLCYEDIFAVRIDTFLQNRRLIEILKKIKQYQ